MDKRLSKEFKLASKGLFFVKFSLLKQEWYKGPTAGAGAAELAAWRKRKKKKQKTREIGFENDMFEYLALCELFWM